MYCENWQEKKQSSVSARAGGVTGGAGAEGAGAEEAGARPGV